MRFGDKLRQIIESFGLSINQVSKATNIKEDKILDILQNRAVPSVEDLDSLSYLIGQDLYALYTKTLSDRDIFEFIEHVDEKNVNLDFNNDYELKLMEKKIKEMKERGETPAKIDYSNKEYHRLYAKNMIYNYNSYEEAIDYIIYYINHNYNINIMDDPIEKFHATDARIVLLLVEALDILGRHKEGLDVLKRLTKCDSLSDEMKIKCLNLIAEIYESKGMYKESYQFADLGIELAIKHNINALMPDLLLWRALAEVALDMTSARSTIDLLLRYTRILRNDVTLDKYVKKFKNKFGIDIMRPGRYHRPSYRY